MIFGKISLNFWRKLTSFILNGNPFARRTTTLAIEDDAIHLVVFRSKEVEKWASFSLDPKIIKDGKIVNPEELGKLIHRLKKYYRIRNKNVLFSISSFHSLSRIITLPKLSSPVIYEAIEREAAREIPAATDASHIFWQIINRTSNYQKFYILATPKSNLNNLALALKKGRVIKGKAELKPLALARLVKTNQAIIVDIQKRSADIVIVIQGIPAFFRMLHLDDQTSTPSIANEISRSIEYFNRNQVQQPINADTPLFVTGNLSLDESDIRQFATILNRRLESLKFPLKCPDDFPSEKFAANIGLAIGALTDKKAESLKWININVLSAINPTHRVFWKLLAVSSAATFGLFSIIPLYQMNGQVAIAKDRAQAEWYRLNQEVVIDKMAKKEIIRLESVLKETETKAEKLIKAQQIIMGRRNNFSHPLTIINETAGSFLILDSIVKTESVITVKGQSQNYDDLIKFIVDLEGKGLFSKVNITNIIKPNPLEFRISFDIELVGK